MSWSIVKLGEVFNVARGGSPRPIQDFLTDDLDGINWIMIGDTKDGSKYIETTAKKIKPEGAKKSRKVKPGDFLLTNSMSFGRPYIVRTSGCIHDGWLVLSPKEENIDTDYFYHYLGSAEVKHRLQGKAAGAVVKNLNSEIVRGLEIPLPPLPEQKRIAAILDKADAIRRKRQQAIQLADEFLRSVFLEMFGDPVTNPKGWDVKTVSECLSEKIIRQVQDGNHGNDHPKVSDFVEEGIPFVTANVVRKGKILFDQCYYLGDEWLEKLRIGFAKPRDVLISHKGSLGFTAVLDDSFDDYIFSPQTTYYRVDENRIIPEYLKAYFDSASFQRLFKKEGIQSTRAYLGITRQKELPIMLPSIHMQREFVDVCDQFKSIIDKLVKSGNELPNCFNSLSQKAFAGEL